jgi:DNA-3-methyladenine glycosylase
MKNLYDPLAVSFYDREPRVVAEDLLGKLLIRELPEGTVVARIVETEAYLFRGDPASHSAIGKTKRNASMFKGPGHAYVYRMRQYTLLNVVTEKEGVGSAVLIRGIEPLQGLVHVHGDTNGPGKLSRALSITHAFDGIPLTEKGDLYIALPLKKEILSIVTTTRIGISKGKEMLLRFYLRDNPHVSRKEKRIQK